MLTLKTHIALFRGYSGTDEYWRADAMSCAVVCILFLHLSKRTTLSMTKNISARGLQKSNAFLSNPTVYHLASVLLHLLGGF